MLLKKNLKKLTKMDLRKEFEKTGYNSWINSDMYPDGKIYTKEYTEWLEKRLVKLLAKPAVDEKNAIEYAEFCVICDREKLPLICLGDYIKHYCD